MLCLAATVLGFVLDLLLGDPRWMPHPVAAIGRLVSRLERALRPAGRVLSPREEYRRGLVLWLVVVTASLLVPLLVLRGAYALHPCLGLALESLLAWLVLATRSLVTEARRVEQPLREGDLAAARKAVARIVGRDTAELSAEGVTKAAVETVAENSSDGIVAPLLYLVLGGAPLALLYKAINTMDSMIGYIDPPYTHFGRFAARADDVANYIPARISAFVMLAAGGLLGLSLRDGYRIYRRDRRKHASPNSAQTESVMAGLLGVQLAGDASYGGHLHHKPHIGDARRPIVPEDIGRSCRVAVATALLALLLFVTPALLLC